MSDYIVRGTAADDSIRVFAAVTTDMVQKACDVHHTTNVATAALGRTMTGAALMGSMLKNAEDVLTVQISGSGPLKGITATAKTDENGAVSVKGYCLNPGADLPLKPNGKLDVGGAVGSGYLTVIKDMGLKEPFAGQTELVSGEIAEDLTYYFATSEQVPSAVALGVLMAPEGGKVLCAGGLIVQLMPFASNEVIDAMEKRISAMEPITTLLAKGMTPEQIIEGLFGTSDFAIDSHVISQERYIGDAFIFMGMDARINEKTETAFVCDCCRDKVARAIMSIDEKDISDMIRDAKPVSVNCHFCNTDYTFSIEELKEILAKKKEK